LGTLVIAWVSLVGRITKPGHAIHPEFAALRRLSRTSCTTHTPRLVSGGSGAAIRDRHKFIQILPILLLGAMSIPVQSEYVKESRSSGISLSGIYDGSSTRIYSEFGSLVNVLRKQPDVRLLTDAPNFVIAKFQSIYADGISTQFSSMDPYSGFEIIQPSHFADSQSLAEMASLRSTVDGRTFTGRFPWFDDSEAAAYTYLNERGDPRDFSISMIGQPSDHGISCTHIAALTERQSVINRRTPRNTDWLNFSLTPCQYVSNHLIFVDSALGHPYYGSADTRVISLNQLEGDPFTPGATFAGVGRRLLFEVLHPSSGMRMVLHLTATLNGDGKNRLPPVLVIGSERQALPVLGRGSARIFSDPITPIIIADRAFVGVDMGVDGQALPEHRTALMGLFGRDVRVDRRILTAFVRDISAVARDELERLSPPRIVRSFPTDLADPDLEYSGVYEDGWISEAAYFGLSQPPEYSTVVARGSVPQTDRPDFTTELRVLVDGQEVAHQALGVGNFELRAPVTSGAGRRRVELRFSATQQLPAPDSRQVGARVELIGFEVGPHRG